MVEDHTCPDENVDCKVYVNGTRVPVADVDIYIRSEGPLSVTRYATGEIASPFRDTDYIKAFDGINTDEQDSFDTVRIDVKDYETENFATQFHGIVTGVGNGEGMSRIWDFRAQGPGLFADKVEASKQFEGVGGIVVSNVLSYIRAKLSERLPFTISGGPVGAPDDASIAPEVQRTNLGRPEGATWEDGEVSVSDKAEKINTSKRFTANRHTLADVIHWIEGETDSRLWLAPTGGGASLFATETPTDFEHSAHYLNGDLRVVENDAFAELRPVNTRVGAGKARRSRKATDEYASDEAPVEYLRVTARHTELYKRAGKTELRAGENLDVDAQTGDEIENKVRRDLTRKIENTTGGDMVTLLRSPIQPYDLIRAKPTCNEQTGTNTDPLKYQVNRVHMKIRADQLSTCRINVGIKTDPVNDITVTREWREA